MVTENVDRSSNFRFNSAAASVDCCNLGRLCSLRDAPIQERMRLFFDRGWMWVDRGGEGINHSQVSDLMTMLFLCWAMQHPEQTFNSFGRCLLEKPETQACVPDLVLYLGEDYPRWREGKPRRIDLMRW